MTHQHHTNRIGFTLVELVIALGIMTIVITIVSELLIEGVRIQDFLSQQTDATSAARKSFAVMTKQIREIADGDNGEYAIVEATASSFIFYSDIDADDATEQIQYFIDITDLKRIIIEPIGEPAVYLPENGVETVIAQHIVNDTYSNTPLFVYYNGDYPGDIINNPLVDPVDITEVALVKIQLDINVNPNRIPDTTQLQTFIQIRNLKTNL